MKRQRQSRVRLGVVRLLAWLAALALWLPAQAARVEEWEVKFCSLAGEAYCLLAPADFGAARYEGENTASFSFGEEGEYGVLRLRAIQPEVVRSMLETMGVPAADVLLNGFAEGNTAVLFSVEQMAKAAGFQKVAVQRAGQRNALFFETTQDGIPVAAALFVDKGNVFLFQCSVSGAASAAIQRERHKKMVESFAAAKTATHAFGKQHITVPADWVFMGTDGNAALGWQFALGGDAASAVVCVVRLGKAATDAPTGAESLSLTARQTLEKMLLKLEEAGLTEDDGFVRLYNCSEDGIYRCVAILVEGDAALLCGVQAGGTYDNALNMAAQIVRSMEAMKGSNRKMALVMAGE